MTLYKGPKDPYLPTLSGPAVNDDLGLSKGKKFTIIPEISLSSLSIATRDMTNALVLLQKLCKNFPYPEKLHFRFKIYRS